MKPLGALMHVNARAVHAVEECRVPKPSDIAIRAPEQGMDVLWDFLIRVSGVCLFLLLIAAYATGEEFQHTYTMIGYAVIALIVVGLWWELFRSHRSRYLDSIFHPPSVRKLFRTAARDVVQTEKVTAGVFVMTVVIIVGLTGIVALLLMVLTHNFYPATNVDEMHEVVAYFALGLVALHVVVVGIATAEHFEQRNKARSAKP